LVEYHSLDRPLQLRVISRSGWGDLCEDEQTCWGKPIRVDRRETARGVTERYVYSKTRFVLLHNGIVTSVQISGTLR
jgi:hypothetical protein